MDYNSQRTPLHMPEYGRIVQSLVEKCKTIEDKNERSEMAASIVDFMGQRNPHLRDEENSRHKLWDHLFILADYDLDVDSPYPIPTRESLNRKPERMEYPSSQGEYKFYGKSITQLIERAIEMADGDEKEALIQVIANNMKKSYNIYNKEHVQDEVICRHLQDLSGGRLDITGLDSLDRSKIYHNQKNNRNSRQQHGNGKSNNNQQRRNTHHKNNKRN
ncbi:MAG: DUF4290 domain-containing protein [Chryseobacterium sp.]|nr:MAG: DUF4290 domain-containing protein [Chryseobacterium sp.]